MKEMAKFLDLSVDGIALGSNSSGANQTEALLTTAGSDVLLLAGAVPESLCRVSGVAQPQGDTDAANQLYVKNYTKSYLQGFKLKPSVLYCATESISMDSVATLRWDYGHNFLTYRDTSGKLFNPNAYTNSWSLAYRWDYSNDLNLTSHFNFACGSLAMGPDMAVVRWFTDPLSYVTSGSQIEFGAGFPGIRMCFAEMPFEALGYSIYFLYTFDITGATATLKIALSHDSGVTFTVPQALTQGSANAACRTSLPFTPGSVTTFNGSGIWNVVISDSILTLEQAFPHMSVDGVNPVAGNRVLLTNQWNPVQNGIWKFFGGQQFKRELDYKVGGEAAGAFVFVDGMSGPGLTNNDKSFLCTSPPGTIVRSRWAQGP